jgi:predicted nuclease with TOPRIM domain
MNERFAEFIDIIRDKDDEIYELKTEMNTAITEKDATIAALNERVKELEEALGEMDLVIRCTHLDMGGKDLYALGDPIRARKAIENVWTNKTWKHI